jgi:two-component system sensor histidine kinase TctE
MPQFFVLPIAVMLIWFGLSRGISPINALQKRLRARRPDDLSAIDENAAPTEIAPLITAMNDLLKRLSTNVLTQQRFVADAAHQLKTPLAGLRTQAELAMREATSGETQASLKHIVAGTIRATRLVNQLLLMANAENTGSVGMTDVDLNAIAREQTLEWVDQSISTGIDLGLDSLDEPILVRGQPLLLAEALNNLIDNALRYTPAPGQVTVSVRRHLTHITLAVEDTGPGIAPEERERVFDRFYRVLGTRADGSGLGLAIVREIAMRHQASIHVSEAYRDQQQNIGTRIEIHFSILDL